MLLAKLKRVTNSSQKKDSFKINLAYNPVYDYLGLGPVELIGLTE